MSKKPRLSWGFRFTQAFRILILGRDERYDEAIRELGQVSRLFVEAKEKKS